MNRHLNSTQLNPITVKRIAVATAIAVVGFHLYYRSMPVPPVSLTERILVAMLFVALAVGIQVSERVRWYSGTLLEILAVFVTIWIIRINTLDNFEASRAATAPILLIGIGIIFRSYLRTAGYYIIALVSLAVGAFLADKPSLDVGMMLGSTGIIMVIAVFTMRSRDRARQELEELSLVAASVHNGVLLTDAEGAVILVNEGFLRMSDLDSADIIGKMLVDQIASGAHNGPARRRIQRALAAGRANRGCHQWQRRPGVHRRLDIHVELWL